MGAQLCRTRWVDQVLAFWFSELAPSDWFRANSAVDEAVSQRFFDLHDEISGTPAEVLLRSSDDMLASVIVLDQFSRNIYRNSPRAFACDLQGLHIAREGIARGFDQELPVDRRLFVYLPFEHSEVLADQDRAVSLIRGLGVDMYTQYALAHRDVIARFGRFPHRNGVLERHSTAAEEAYLNQPGSGF